MNGLKCFLYIICLLGAAVLSGCVIVSGEPVAVEVEEIEIGFPPPPPPPMVIVEHPARPSRFHVWIEGHHVIHSGRWVWVGGYWTRPVRRGATWVPGHTRRSGKVWIWRPGCWH